MKYITIFKNTIKIIFAFSSLNLFFINVIHAQVPTTFAKNSLIPKSGIYNANKIDSVITPFVNKDSLLIKEKNNNCVTCENFKFGYAFDVNYDLASGSWDNTKTDGKIWKLKIISKGAYSINLIFDKLNLPKGASLYIYNETGTMVYGPVTSANCNASGMFASDIIFGESIILEYFEPNASLKEGKINISKVIHGYKDVFRTNDYVKDYNVSGDCEIDINCPEGDDWCVESRAVAMILKNENTELCSGALINNVKEDFSPYFLTANHCLGSDFNPNTALFRFRYKNPTCNAPSYYGIYWTFTGASLRANASVSDFALLELNNYNANNNIDRIAGVHFAGWTRNNSPPSSGAGIHHPRGDVMKISLFGSQVVSSYINTAGVGSWLLNFDNGITEKGSSGSPLFNQNHLIVGQLYGTTSNQISCDNQDGDAVYGRFDISWNNGLKNWLDPFNTGKIEVDAISPPIIYHNKTISGGAHLYTAKNEMELAGNISGYPNMPPNWPTNTWPFPVNDVPFVVEPGTNLEFKSGKRIVIKPGTHVKEGATARGYISPVTCSDGLDYHRALYKTYYGNTACHNSSVNYNDHYSNFETTKNFNNKSGVLINTNRFSSHPNPFRTYTTITFSLQQASKVNIYITNSYGQKVHEVFNNYTEAGCYHIRLDGAELHPGLYFCIMETEISKNIIKIIKM